MEFIDLDQNRLRHFLLGALPEAEREAIEDRLLDDADLFTALTEAEDDLIEEFARGELTPEERAQLERGLLSLPAMRRRAELLRTLQVSVRTSDQPPILEPKPSFFASRFWRFAAVAGALIVLAGAAWWLIRARVSAPRRQDPVTAGVNQPATPTPSAVPLPVNTPAPEPTGGTKLPPVNENEVPPPPTQPTVATLVLIGGMTRGEGVGAVLELDPEVTVVQIELTLESTDYRQYRASLFDENGRQLWRSGVIRPRGTAVTIGIPGSLFSAGDYRIKLEGLAGSQFISVDNYVFQVHQHL